MSIKGWRALLVTAAVGAAMWAGIAWAAMSMASAEDGTQEVVVPCPTEDSCSVDYRDGAYHIERVSE